jgi:hypothetical protein
LILPDNAPEDLIVYLQNEKSFSLLQLANFAISKSTLTGSASLNGFTWVELSISVFSFYKSDAMFFSGNTKSILVI